MEAVPFFLVDGIVELLAFDNDLLFLETLALHVLVGDSDRSSERF